MHPYIGLPSNENYLLKDYVRFKKKIYIYVYHRLSTEVKENDAEAITALQYFRLARSKVATVV